jgi:hypothetical protein
MSKGVPKKEEKEKEKTLMQKRIQSKPFFFFLLTLNLYFVYNLQKKMLRIFL